MAKNWINVGHAIPFTGAATSGEITKVGDNLIGVADQTTEAGENNQLHVVGHFTLPKGNFALAAGDMYLIDADMNNVNAGGADVKAFGIVTRDAAETLTHVDVIQLMYKHDVAGA